MSNGQPSIVIQMYAHYFSIMDEVSVPTVLWETKLKQGKPEGLHLIWEKEAQNTKLRGLGEYCLISQFAVIYVAV